MGLVQLLLSQQPEVGLLLPQSDISLFGGGLSGPLSVSLQLQVEIYNSSSATWTIATLSQA